MFKGHASRNLCCFDAFMVTLRTLDLRNLKEFIARSWEGGKVYLSSRVRTLCDVAF